MAEKGKTGPVRLYYFNGFSNFGDLLNENILRRFGYEAEREEFTTAEMTAVGSLLDRIIDRGNMHINDVRRQEDALRDVPMYLWGPGFMYDYEDTDHKPVRPFIVKALRGEISRKQLSDFMGEDVHCVLGDPGLLAPYLVPPQKKKYEVGIVPHHYDSKDERILQLKEQYPDSLLINVKQKPERVIRQIAQCRRIISTSLHGIITADAYNIPSCWCEVSDKVEGNGHKFHDYFSAFGTDREPFDLRNGGKPDPEKDFSVSFGSYAEVRRKQKELVGCFPYPIPFYRRSYWIGTAFKKARSFVKKMKH